MAISKLLENINYSNFTYRIEKLKITKPGRSPLHPGEDLRDLSDAEVSSLRNQGNICSDWTLIRVQKDFITDKIWQNHFIGEVVMGRYDGRHLPDRTGGGSLPGGIYRSTIEDTHIGSNCAIHNCPSICRTLIVRDSLISNSNTGMLFDDKTQGTLYGNGVRIPVGAETGGREISLYSDLSLELAEFVLRHPGDARIQRSYADHLDEYLKRIRFTWTIIDKHSRILDCKAIINSYIGPYSRIQGADEIFNSSIFSTREDPSLVSNSSVVRNSIVQDGVTISDASIIQNSMLFEHSHAEHHGKIVDSIIGPNSGVSKGEITSCFLGPFVGFHHQSLLIAAFWPGGRGNVGYGANVGSNHTSRMPDQECWPGEGMFFGLSCAIKYPANFSEAPYSIVAAGVTTLPQKLQFPFSLINEPVGYYLEVPPGFNNLIPAWGLYNNLYSLKRNEGKYRTRNKARRNHFDLRLFRPDILEHMQRALDYLSDIKERKTIYLPGDIPGIGKNMLTDENRLRAIEAYRFFIRFVELQELKNRLELSLGNGTSGENSGRKEKSTANAGQEPGSAARTAKGGNNASSASPAQPGPAPLKPADALAASAESADSPTADRPADTYSSAAAEALQEYLAMLPEIISGTETSRQRDISRGSSIIPDYKDTHPSVDEDPFVIQVRGEIAAETSSIQRLLDKLTDSAN